MKWIVMVLLILGMGACEIGERLEVRNMGDAPGYFIECYCRPGEMYEMTATQLAPIDEAQILDYSIPFKIHVVADDSIRLYHSLFTRPGTSFFYNYASARRLDPALVDTIYMEAIAPDGKKMTARTTIPDPVKIDTVIWDGKILSTYFTTSKQTDQNHFILNVSYAKEGKTFSFKYFLSDYREQQSVRYDVEIKQLWVEDWLIVTLKRMTEEGFKYQYSLSEAESAGKESLFSPVELSGNIEGALGVFTCYTIDSLKVK